MKEEENARLVRWLQWLTDEKAVVAYSPKKGFLYVLADEIDDGDNGLPVRRRLILPEELEP